MKKQPNKVGNVQSCQQIYVLNNQIDLSDLNTCVDTFEHRKTKLFKPHGNVNKHDLYLT